MHRYIRSKTTICNGDFWPLPPFSADSADQLPGFLSKNKVFSSLLEMCFFGEYDSTQTR